MNFWTFFKEKSWWALLTSKIRSLNWVDKWKKTFIRASLYHMLKKKLLLIKSYLKEHLKKDFIIVSSTSFVSLILFAKKSSEELCFCVDYRKLNEFIKKNNYLISFIIDLMTWFFKAKFFIEIDICHAFNRIKMTTKRDKDLTTFKTRFKA